MGGRSEMSLAKRLAETKPLRTGRPCSVGVLLSSLNKEDAQALLDVLAVPKGDPNRLSAHHLSNILREEGHHIPHKSLELHRKGACRCEPGRPSST